MPWALSGSTGTAALQQSAFAWDGAFGNIMNASALWKNIKWEGSFCKTTEPPTLEPPMLGQEKKRPLQEDYDPANPSNDHSIPALPSDDVAMEACNQDVSSITSPVTSKRTGGKLF